MLRLRWRGGEGGEPRDSGWVDASSPTKIISKSAYLFLPTCVTVWRFVAPLLLMFSPPPKWLTQNRDGKPCSGMRPAPSQCPSWSFLMSIDLADSDLGNLPSIGFALSTTRNKGYYAVTCKLNIRQPAQIKDQTSALFYRNEIRNLDLDDWIQHILEVLREVLF